MPVVQIGIEQVDRNGLWCQLADLPLQLDTVGVVHDPKAEKIEQLGGFDEGLPACEDYDLWLRISCRYPVRVVGIGKDLAVVLGIDSDEIAHFLPGFAAVDRTEDSTTIGAGFHTTGPARFA